MWGNISQEVRDQDYSWIENCTENGTLVLCTNGSYKQRKSAPCVVLDES